VTNIDAVRLRTNKFGRKLAARTKLCIVLDRFQTVVKQSNSTVEFVLNYWRFGIMPTGVLSVLGKAK